jgi:hypothetical protein
MTRTDRIGPDCNRIIRIIRQGAWGSNPDRIGSHPLRGDPRSGPIHTPDRGEKCRPVVIPCNPSAALVPAGDRKLAAQVPADSVKLGTGQVHEVGPASPGQSSEVAQTRTGQVHEVSPVQPPPGATAPWCNRPVVQPPRGATAPSRMPPRHPPTWCTPPGATVPSRVLPGRHPAPGGAERVSRRIANDSQYHHIGP